MKDSLKTEMLFKLATKLKEAGLTCYWSNQPQWRTWLHIGDDTGVCYVQVTYGTFQLSSVHVPNRTSGTGYQLHESLSMEDITPELIHEAMQIGVPHWHRGDSIPEKYTSIEDYLKRQRYPDSKMEVRSANS